MYFCFKPSTAPQVNNGSVYDLRELGSEGTIDFENSSGKSIYGNGNPSKVREFYTKYTSQTGNPCIKGGYIMNFSEDIKAS